MNTYVWNLQVREGSVSTFMPWLPPGIELVNYRFELSEGVAHIALTVRVADAEWAHKQGMVPCARPAERRSDD